jgi:hypothetical protein
VSLRLKQKLSFLVNAQLNDTLIPMSIVKL